MKTLLVGEAPPQSRMRDTPTSLPFSGAAGKRFSDMLGEDVTQVFETRNLLSVWPGRSSKGSLFPLALARAGMRDLVKEIEDSYSGLDPSTSLPRLILAGQRVANAFRLREWPQLEWHTTLFGGATVLLPFNVAIIPHPSAVNRAWNDPETTERVRTFLLDEKRRMDAEASH